METKLIAAEIATGAGVSTVILSSQNVRKLSQIMEYNHLHTHQQPQQYEDLPPRPAHTLFKPSTAPLPDLKLWTAHTLFPAGAIVIDGGAHSVLARRDSGGRLLPAGVRAVRGTFASGQAVRVLVVRPSFTTAAATVGALLDSNPASGARTPDLGLGMTAQSSMDALVRHPSTSFDPLAAAASVVRTEEDDLEEDALLEVGRGLANYNSLDIARVKGQKRFVFNCSEMLRLCYAVRQLLIFWDTRTRST
jgi:glutamate 5-kinase